MSKRDQDEQYRDDIAALRWDTVAKAWPTAARRELVDVLGRFEVGIIEAVVDGVLDPGLSGPGFMDKGLSETQRRIDVRRERAARRGKDEALDLRVCRQCLDQDWVEVPDETQEGYTVPVRPCSVCRPSEYEAWRLRGWRVRMGRAA